MNDRTDSDEPMDVDAYLEGVVRLAHEFVGQELATYEELERRISEGDRQALLLVRTRSELLAPADWDALRPFLSTGLFRDVPDRAASFAVLFDIERAVHLCALENACARYDGTQRLFRAAPWLLGETRDEELVPANRFEQIEGSELVRVGSLYSKIAGHLSPQLVAWCRSEFPDAPLYIRLNPHFVATSQPPQAINEAVLVPADPRWWQRLEIFEGESKRATYVLQDCEPTPRTLQQFWDYRIRRVRLLDASAKKYTGGNLRMSVEELQECNGFHLGRMLHLDTDAPKGTPFSKAMLNHLDLAINVYEGTAGESRLNEFLVDGTTKATFRTHLLRIENVPFPVLLALAEMFLESRVLFGEWVQDQFELPDLRRGRGQDPGCDGR